MTPVHRSYGHTLTSAALVLGAALVLSRLAYRSVHLEPKGALGHLAGDRHSYTLDFTTALALSLLVLYVAVSFLNSRPGRRRPAVLLPWPGRAPVGRDVPNVVSGAPRCSAPGIALSEGNTGGEGPGCPPGPMAPAAGPRSSARRWTE